MPHALFAVLMLVEIKLLIELLVSLRRFAHILDLFVFFSINNNSPSQE